jgi:transcriptional regulator of heat shock response
MMNHLRLLALTGSAVAVLGGAASAQQTAPSISKTPPSQQEQLQQFEQDLERKLIRDRIEYLHQQDLQRAQQERQQEADDEAALQQRRDAQRAEGDRQGQRLIRDQLQQQPPRTR